LKSLRKHAYFNWELGKIERWFRIFGPFLCGTSFWGVLTMLIIDYHRSSMTYNTKKNFAKKFHALHINVCVQIEALWLVFHLKKNPDPPIHLPWVQVYLKKVKFFAIFAKYPTLTQTLSTTNSQMVDINSVLRSLRLVLL